MEFYSFRSAADALFLLVAFALVIVSLLLVANALLDHMRNYKYPALQTCCMRILLLAPIYALVSWVMMAFPPNASYIEILRDAYETYSLFCFWVMLVLWCGGQRRVIDTLGRDDPASARSALRSCYLCPLMQPCGCGIPVTSFRDSSNLFRYLRSAVTQLMVVKPTAALGCALFASDPLVRRRLRFGVLISTAVAMHSIFSTYIAMRPYTRGLDASRKFLSIKVVVAVILLQEVVVNGALSMDLIPEGRFGYTVEDHALRLMCTATIVEMALFSLLLSYLFSHRSFSYPDDARRLPASARTGVHVVAPAAAATLEDGESREPGNHEDRVSIFEHVLGDTLDRSARTANSPESVSLWSVLAVWDVLLMTKVEEQSIQGVPLPIEFSDDDIIPEARKQGSAQPEATGGVVGGLTASLSTRPVASTRPARVSQGH